jgi:hypothetical protein
MPDNTNHQFKLTANITGYTLRKSEDGTETYVLTGLASDTNSDLTGDLMAETALNARVKSRVTKSSPSTTNTAPHGTTTLVR